MTNRRNNFAVPAGWSQQERRFGESIKQNLDTLQGNRGDKLDRAVTFRDLLDANVVRLADGVTSFGGGAGEVTPTDPNSVTETDVPPAPTSLSANGSLQTIHLSWDLEVYRGHSHVEIHRHTSDDVANATLVAQVSGYTGVFGDPVGANKTYYYWVRAVNHAEVYGPFNSSAGTVGQTSPDVDFILNTLTNAITSSHLANSLGSRIDLIDAAASVTGSVAYQVAQEATARASAIATEASTRASAIAAESSARASAISAETSARVAAINAIFTDIPIHDSTADYSADQIVRVSNSNSKLYIAIQAVAGSANIALTNTSYWKLYGDYDSLKSSTDSSAAAITQINTVSSSSTSAAAQAIDALETTVNDSSSGVAATSTALGALTTRVTTAEGGITTNASDISALESTVNDSSTGVAATSTALGALTTRVTTAEGGITTNASDISALESTVNNSSTGVAATSTALGALTTRVTTAEGGITTNASDITALENTVNDSSTGVAATSTALGALTTRVTTAEGGITTNASDITALENTVNDSSTGVAATSTALGALTTRVTTAEGGITTNASDITALENTVNDSSTGVSATSTALGALTTRVTTAEGGITTNASDITALENTVNDSSTGVAATSTALGALTTRVTTAEGSITTNASDITALENTVNDSSTGVAATSTALGALTTRVTTAEGSITTNASDITALENTVNDSSTGVAATSTALGALTTRVTSAEGNITTNASDITALETTVNNPTTGVAATATALSSLTSTVTSQGNSITANANSTSQISARLNDINDTGSGGAVTVEEAYTATATNTNDVTSLKGQYTVKIDNDGHVAGFGLASTSSSSGNTTSEFIVRADRFAVVNATSESNSTAWASNGGPWTKGDIVKHNGFLYVANLNHNNSVTPSPVTGANSEYYWDCISTPFVVQTTTDTNVPDGAGGTTTVYPGVYIRSANIKKASIQSAQIGSVNAETINTGFLDVTNRIDANAINASKLNIDGSVIISDNSSGTPVLTLGPTSITSAYIGTAAVETLKIAGQAVTIPSSSFTSSGTTISNGSTYTDLATITFTSTGNPVTINASAYFKNFASNQGASYYFRLVRGSTSLTEQNLQIGAVDISSGSGTMGSMAFLDTSTTTGSRTYKIQARRQSGNGNITALNRSITAIEVKR